MISGAYQPGRRKATLTLELEVSYVQPGLDERDGPRSWCSDNAGEWTLLMGRIGITEAMTAGRYI